MPSLLSQEFLLLGYLYQSTVVIWPKFPVTCLSCVHSGSSLSSSSTDTSHVVVVQSPSRVRLFATHRLQHARPLCPSPSPQIGPSSCPLHQWCHPAISSSDALFSFRPQSFPASGTFPLSQLFASDGQNIGVLASASDLPMNIQDWFHLGWTGWISLLSKGLSRVFSNTTVQKHQFFSSQLSL